MGQKINPTGLRIGVIKDWESRWYCDKKNFGDTLVSDDKLRKYLLKSLAPAGVPKVEIERDAKRVRVNIHCAKPGMVIGRQGADIEKLRVELEKMIGAPVSVNVVEVIIALARVGGAGIAEGTDIGFLATVGTGTIAAEFYVVVFSKAILNATDAKHAIGIGRGDDGAPLLIVGLVASAVNHQYTLTGGEVAGLGDIGGAIHVLGVVAFLSVAEGGGDDVGAVLVGPFHSHLPPDFLFERF